MTNRAGRKPGSKNRKTAEQEARIQRGFLLCYTCQEERLLTEFGPSKNQQLGYNTKCRPCQRDYYAGVARHRNRTTELKPGEPGTFEWNERQSLLSLSGLKACTRCRLELSTDNFYYDEKRSRFTPDCRECRRYKGRIVRIRAYGVTVPEYEHITARPCEVCGTVERKRVLDHDHVTGTVRGALCDRCNVSLGNMDDNPVLLRRAADYLEQGGTP